MNEFARGFLNEDWAALPEAPRIYLGAFGKHPGWNDHLDDIGLATASLIEARRLLYAGITQQIESAAWDKAGGERVAAGFDHLFHWRRPGESLTGLMWSSRDGKGRSLYPMVAVAHCVGRPFAWVADVVLPALEAAATKCRQTTSADAVVSIVNETQQWLRVRMAGDLASTAGTTLGRLACTEFFQRESTALPRVLHHLRHQFGAFAPGTEEWCESDQHAQSRSLRLPQIPGTRPAESLHAWLSFLRTQLNPAVPILGLLRLDGTWIDVIVGEPAPADFFVLRALNAAVPLVTDIPYQLEPEFAASCAALLTGLEGGKFPETSLFNGKTVVVNRAVAARWLDRCQANGRPGFIRRLFGGSGNTSAPW